MIAELLEVAMCLANLVSELLTNVGELISAAIVINVWMNGLSVGKCLACGLSSCWSYGHVELLLDMWCYPSMQDLKRQLKCLLSVGMNAHVSTWLST